eukprot:XP_028345694.1 endonuclease/exonuclease/phosphatase family domain-containing protein 1 isoform X1 [Physeter catodon]
MGSTLGCHRSIPRDPSDLSHSRKFSAACNFSNILVNQERLNINTATEEELMTLPGVTRAVARSIVEYREYIGGFKKVEDLALVSGVGATKLEQVKFEICVSSKGSSAQHSPSSLRRDLLAEQQPHHLATAVPLTPRVNINTATPAQLMSVRGLTEKMAVSIVDYRREHGPFRSVEDLVRMGGVNAAFLDRIRHQVFAERSRPPSTHTNGGLTFTAKPHPSPTSLSLQSEDLDLPPGGPTQIISTRPSVEAFGGTRDGRPVLRLATWNLQGCSVEKANNPGVREVVCMTLLENSIKLLAVQELLDREALEKVNILFLFPQIYTLRAECHTQEKLNSPSPETALIAELVCYFVFLTVSEPCKILIRTPHIAHRQMSSPLPCLALSELSESRGSPCCGPSSGAGFLCLEIPHTGRRPHARCCASLRLCSCVFLSGLMGGRIEAARLGNLPEENYLSGRVRI